MSNTGLSEKFTNGLSDAETERLALLSEELGEAVQMIGKILRHGYESVNPDVEDPDTNRELLERELGDVSYAAELMVQNSDIRKERIFQRVEVKARKVKRYLHHQSRSGSEAR